MHLTFLHFLCYALSESSSSVCTTFVSDGRLNTKAATDRRDGKKKDCVVLFFNSIKFINPAYSCLFPHSTWQEHRPLK
jgi:hypothetical protein